MQPPDSPERIEALARSRVYAYLGAWLRYPDEASWSALARPEERAGFAEACDALGERAPYRALPRHRGGLPLEGLDGPEALAERYAAVFGHTISKTCPPYETEYGNLHLFQQSDHLADLAGFYRAFGVAAEAGRERLDHIAIELEFLYLLTFKEARALEEGKAEAAALCRDAQAAFVEDHIGRWAPVFARRLERADPEGPFAAAARLLADFIGAEAQALAAEAEPAPDLARGEMLPVAAEEWDASDWQQDETIEPHQEG